MNAVSAGVLALLRAQTKCVVYDTLIPDLNDDGTRHVPPNRYILAAPGQPRHSSTRLAGLETTAETAIVTHAVGLDRVQAAWVDDIVTAQLLNRPAVPGSDALVSSFLDGPLLDKSVVPYRVYFRRIWTSRSG